MNNDIKWYAIMIIGVFIALFGSLSIASYAESQKTIACYKFTGKDCE